MSNNPIQIIIPYTGNHPFSDYVDGIKSVLSQGLKVFFVYPENLDISKIQSNNSSLTFCPIAGDSSRINLINECVAKYVDELYFAILDAKQVYSHNYFGIAFKNYINLVEKSVYLNIVCEKENDKLAALSNYRAWDRATHEQLNHTLGGIGTMTKNMLTNRFLIVSTCGAIYNAR